jgi:hypothetical protein
MGVGRCINGSVALAEQSPGLPGLDLPGFDIVPLARGYGCDAARVEDVGAIKKGRDVGWKGYGADAFAARSIKRATSSGLETYTAWLAGTSIVSLPARLAMLRSRSGLMLWSRVATSAQLFF